MNVGDRVRVRGQKGVWTVGRIWGKSGLVYIVRGPDAMTVHTNRLAPEKKGKKK